MYIRKVLKKNKGFEKEFAYLHLVESVRTSSGPRQRLVLNLGAIEIDESQYKDLADCIESLLNGNEVLFPFDEHIVEIAEKAKDKILLKAKTSSNTEADDRNDDDENYTPCNLSTLSASTARSIGPEHVAHEMWKLLAMDKVLVSHGLSENQISLCKAQVIGRLCKPGSDLSTWDWVENRSGLYEIIPYPDKHSLPIFYRVVDHLLEVKAKIESHLNQQEQSLFNLPKRFCLFDLTNTFLEGQMLGNPKAKFGRSKEKRYDCKLLTLGLIIDEHGFPEKTMFFEGSQSEPETLEKMIKSLMEDNLQYVDHKPHIIVDAGISTAENLAFLKAEGFKYIVVSKAKSDCTIEQEELEFLKITKSGSEIRAKREIIGEEALLLCHSDRKEAKERSMMSSKEIKFIKALEKMKANILDPSKKKVTRSYEKVLLSLGRLKEKYAYAAKKYQLSAIPNEAKEKAVDIEWSLIESMEEKAKEAMGCYLLRTNDLELTEEQIWDTYNLLTRVEASFRSIKSDTGLRPVFHSKESRANAHMFISVLAYHIINVIEFKLRQKGDNRSWSTLREILSTHIAVSINLQAIEAGVKVAKNIRTCTKPEAKHMQIYTALEISHVPFEPQTVTLNL